MALSQRQQLLQQQKLSPQQIQMIKLLELPAAMLEQRIKQEIEQNIVLEEDHSENEGEEPKEISMDEYLKEDDTPSYKTRLNHYSKDDRPRNFQISGGRSLQESLIEQLGFKNLNDIERQLAEFIVGSIDSDGYLRRDLQSLSDDIAFTLGIEVSIDELERLLGIIQHLEPVGVGARDLRESLLCCYCFLYIFPLHIFFSIKLYISDNKYTIFGNFLSIYTIPPIYCPGQSPCNSILTEY